MPIHHLILQEEEREVSPTRLSWMNSNDKNVFVYDLQSVAGTSIGALFAILVVRMPPTKTGVGPYQQRGIYLNIDMANLFYRWGLDDGKNLYQFVDRIVEEQTGKPT